MLRGFPLVVSKTVSVWLVVLSLLLAGLGHTSVLSATDEAKVTYLASMGLTAADLCAVPGQDSEGIGMGDCPVCHLASAMLLPDAGLGLSDIDQRYAATVLLPAQLRGFGRSHNPATPVRAPPLV